MVFLNSVRTFVEQVVCTVKTRRCCNDTEAVDSVVGFEVLQRLMSPYCLSESHLVLEIKN